MTYDAIGFVLINTAPAKEHEVYRKLKKCSVQDVGAEIEYIEPLFGEYDIIAKVKAEDFNAIGHFVVDGIRTIPGVMSASTLCARLFTVGAKE